MRQDASNLSKWLILVIETQDFGSMLFFESHDHLLNRGNNFWTLFASQISWNGQLSLWCSRFVSPCLLLKVMIMSTMKPKNFKGYLPVQHGKWIRPAKLRDITYLMTIHQRWQLEGSRIRLIKLTSNQLIFSYWITIIHLLLHLAIYILLVLKCS